MKKLLQHTSRQFSRITNTIGIEINRLKDSPFVGNVTTMMTGTAVAQFVPVLISPILTRIFTPDDFGILTVFLSYSMIVSTIISGKYEMAIMLPKSREDAINLSGLATLLTVILSSVFMIFLILFKDSFALLPGADKISNWALILPVTAGIIAYGNVLNYWISRNKKFASISTGKFIQTLTTSGFNIGFGLLNPIPLVLILGNLIGQFLNAFYLTYIVVKYQAADLKALSIRSFIKEGREHIKFPLFDIPNSLSYSISTQGMNLVFTKFFGET
ncbi:MAG: oligosaccharide flippase family protein, partial [Bacteroidales bacterium]|nr:oligosaccharide flippase family protein [Bacteroidales bacterium]